tara:strand:- start:220 stop:660 length:441 start_codon:yes stop_codon:yes gene_type:complete
MALHDYKCRHCDHVQSDLVFTVNTPRGIPRHIKCTACGKLKACVQIFTFGNPVKNTGIMYSNTNPHPQFGFPIKSYSHKQELMEQYDLQEISDPVGGNRQASAEDWHDTAQPDPDGASGGVFWGDDDMNAAAIAEKERHAHEVEVL